jgi:glutathione synthetase
MKAFHKAKSLAPDFNLLVDKISRNHKFLNDTLAGGEFSVISKDEYTKKLLQLYNEIYTDEKDAEVVETKPNFAHLADRLGIQRSDYMLNPSSTKGEFELKQVELNTIAASFAGLATGVARLHSILTNRYGNELKDWIKMNSIKVMGEDYLTNNNDVDVGVPDNTALEKLAYAMSISHERYNSRFVDKSANNEKGSTPIAILFIVQDGETNTVDQRKLEFQLWEEHKVPVVRMSLTTAHHQLKLDPNDGSLYILGESNGNDGKESIQFQVSLVYYRAGYAPTDYPDGYDGIEWKSREKIERSRATKCPSLGYHLAGTKKVQQELARPGVLEQFFDNGDEKVESMRDAFAGLFSLGDDAVNEDIDAVKDVLISGSAGNYVLKPQREGGGYNYYGDRLTEKIQENVKVNDDGSVILGEDLAEFILMQRLFPPKQTAVLLRAGIVEGRGESISELGCFGTILQSFDGETTLHNEYAGFLLRTKFENVDEGGVASGFATLSSPYLC